MDLKFYGAVQEVTGSNILVEASNTRLLVDCGVFQGRKMIEDRNYEPFPYDAHSIKVVLLTHAHLDHCGRLPKLYHAGFRGKIFATAATLDLTLMSLNDSADIIEEEALENGRLPYYTKDDVANLTSLFQPVEYDQTIEVLPGIKACFREAGHILGSASIELFADGEKIVFSGDLGNHPVPILRPPATIDSADYVVMESTYGHDFHGDLSSRRKYLQDAVDYIIKHRGVLMIPAFAIQRTQEILYELDTLIEEGKIPADIPIYVDSPLAIEATEIFSKYPNYYNDQAKKIIRSGDDFLHFKSLKFTPKVEDSKAINFVDPPKIVIAGSGMITAGRITHHIRRYISDERNYLLIVGFQVAGTMGRRLMDGEKQIGIFHEKHIVRAKVEVATCFSAHADQKQLIEWLSNIKGVKKVYLNHGEKENIEALSVVVQKQLNLTTEIPQMPMTKPTPPQVVATA
ncbi:MAG: MBL fold metallo-hydrolase [bacterium]|nr:MBL fold metallo-hydrolase [bacterium]